MNPCPCGHHGSTQRHCTCSQDAVARYQGRISGPLRDRIDLQIEVPSVAHETLLDAPDGESSAAVAARVAAARSRQAQRQGCLNAMLAGAALDRHAQLSEAGRRLLESASARLGWSARSHHRVLRLARTVADLADAPQIEAPHLAEAIQYRRVLATT